MKFFLLFLAFSFSTIAADIPYVNWENHPIHALDISPDKTRLAIAHTADNRVQLFDISLGYPVRLGHVKVGVDPVAVRFKDNNELWVVNHISDSVSVVDFKKRIIINTLQVKDEPFDVVFANNKAFVSCSQANQIMVFDALNLQLAPTIIDVMAEDPRAMAVNKDGTKVYIASFESGNGSTILAGGIDESDGTLNFPNNPVNREASPYGGENPPKNNGTGFIPSINPNLPTPPKVSLIVKQSPDGRWLDDNGKDWTHMVSGDQANLSGRIPGWKLLDHDITVIDSNSLEVSYVSNLMNSGMAIAYNTAKDEITLVGTDATNEIRYEPNLNGTFIRVKLGVVAASNLSSSIVTDLNPHLTYQSSTVDQTLRDQSIGDPRGIIWNNSGNRGYISGMGSNNVIVVDANGNRIDRIEVGEGATGIGIDEDRNRLYVWNHFATSLSTIDLTTNTQMSQLQVFNPLPVAIKEGRKFLYGTHETSGLGQAACASCHIDGRMDKLSWDLGDPSGEMKVFNQNCQTEIPSVTAFECSDYHPMKGPMMTQTLQDIIGNEPFHWRGDRNGIEEFNGAFQSINGDDEQLTDTQMQQFKAFLSTITFPPNPFRNSDNTLPNNIELTNHYTSGRFAPAGQPLGSGNPQHGLELFNLGLLDNVFQCGSCHTLPTGMAVNGSLMLGVIAAPVGGEIMPLGPMDANHLGIVSVDGSTQKAIKTPQLRNMYDKVGFEMSRPESLLGFGFLHDGAIDSISRFLSAGAFSVKSDQEVADLVALMMAFSGSELENGFIPLGAVPEQSQDTHAGVGKQYVLTEATQANTQIDELITLSNSGKVDLIVSSVDQNYLFQPATSSFINQQNDELSSIGLMALASHETPLNFTIVPLGLGQRLAFDRDGDGIYDYQEIINGSDPTDANSMDIRPKSGLWFNPSRSGHGLDVEMAGENLLVIWYTYNDDGTPTFYLASAPYAENWQANIIATTWDFTDRVASSSQVGSINLNINSAKSMNFSWSLNGRIGSEDFIYFDVSEDMTSKQFTGTYYDVDDSGWGLTVFTQGQSQVAVVYYYDENGLPRWALGSDTNAQITDIALSSFLGFCPDCSWVSATGQTIGNINLQFQPNRSIALSTHLTYPENLTGTWDINHTIFSALSDAVFDPEIQ